MIIDKRATSQERASTLAEALSKLDLTTVALSAKTRQLVDAYAMRRAS